MKQHKRLSKPSHFSASSDSTQALRQGRVEQWHDEKGFGFIETDDGNSVFFHISEFRPPRRPSCGEKVVFRLAQGKGDKPKAIQVQEFAFVQQKQTQQRKKRAKQRQYQAQQQAFESGQTKNLAIGVLFYLCLIVFGWKGLLAWQVVGWYVAIGVVTFIAYAKDKHAAQNGKWRTPENTLHMLALAGGWVGAMLAQTYLRHKSQKRDFRLKYYVTVLVNLALLIYFVLMQTNT